MNTQNLDTLYEIVLRMSPQDFINRCTIDKTFGETCKRSDLWKQKLDSDFMNITNDRGLSYIESLNLGNEQRRLAHMYIGTVFSSTKDPKEQYIAIANMFSRIVVSRNDVVAEMVVPNPSRFLSMRGINTPATNLFVIQTLMVAGKIVGLPTTSDQNQVVLDNQIIWFCGLINGKSLKLTVDTFSKNMSILETIDCPSNTKNIKFISSN